MSDGRKDTKDRWRVNNNGLTHIEAVWRRRNGGFVDGVSPCGVDDRGHRSSERDVEVNEPFGELFPRIWIRGLMLKHEESMRIGRRRGKVVAARTLRAEDKNNAYLAVGEPPPPIMDKGPVGRSRGKGIDVLEALHHLHKGSTEGLQFVHEGRMC